MDEEWLKKYQRFVFDVITPLAVPASSANSVNLRKKMVNPDAMRYWIRSITHQSFDPNNDANYETLEKFGDLVMKTTYERIVIGKHPDIDAETLSNLEAAHVSRIQQAELSDKIGLGQYLRSIYVINQHIREDLLEAMFGAMMLVGEEIIGKGNGFIMCSNALNKLYSDKINNIQYTSEVKIGKNPKQELKEIGDKLGWYKGPPTLEEFGKPIEIKDKFGATVAWKVTYTLPPRAITWMEAHGRRIINKGVLAEAQAKDKLDVEDEIVNKSLRVLRENYDVDYAELVMRKRKYTKAVEKRMEEDDEIRIDVDKDKNSNYYQLIGTKSDGTKEVLLTVHSELGPKTTAKAVEDEILRVYEETGKLPLGEVLILR